jgi:hypothetical protein
MGPQVEDGEDGLQIWRVAEYILNTKSRTADKWWPSSVGVGRGVAIPHSKNHGVMKCYTGPRTWTDSLERPRQRNSSGSGQGQVMDSCEDTNEPSDSIKGGKFLD